MDGTKVYRQGELLFIETKIPTDLPDVAQVLQDKGDNCIREGEVSGHKHEVFFGKLWNLLRTNLWYNGKNEKGEAAGQEQMQLPEGQMAITSKERIEIRHPEHKPLVLPAGEYVVRIQREYEEGKDRLVVD